MILGLIRQKFSVKAGENTNKHGQTHDAKESSEKLLSTLLTQSL